MFSAVLDKHFGISCSFIVCLRGSFYSAYIGDKCPPYIDFLLSFSSPEQSNRFITFHFRQTNSYYLKVKFGLKL